MAPKAQSLLASFFLFQNRNKHLESRIKGITQLEEPICVDYCNNLPDGLGFPTLGGSELEYLTKNRLTPLRKRTKGLEGGDQTLDSPFLELRLLRLVNHGGRFLDVCMPTGLVAVINYLAHGLRVYICHTKGCGRGCVKLILLHPLAEGSAHSLLLR